MKMENSERKSIKVDLESLLSCIRCHEESNDVSVIQGALKTIIHICSNTNNAKDVFREIGGLEYLLRFMCVTNSVLLLETSMKTLSYIVDENAHNQKKLTCKEVFNAIHAILLKKDIDPLVLKHAVLLLSTILYQNIIGQVLATETGCIHELINLYKNIFPYQVLNNNGINFDTSADMLTSFEMWRSINRALCFAVNNPLNDKNQMLCSTLFPMALKILESVAHPDIACSISLLLSLTIANNEKNQDEFAELGGLLVIKKCLQRCVDAIFADMTEYNDLVNKGNLRATYSIIGIIDTSSLENEKNASLFGKLGVLSLLIRLLNVALIDVHWKTRIILIFGHCIDICPMNRAYLLNEENVSDVLKSCMLIGDEDLLSACKYLLQVVCLKNDDYKMCNREEHPNEKINASPMHNSSKSSICNLRNQPPVNEAMSHKAQHSEKTSNDHNLKNPRDGPTDFRREFSSAIINKKTILQEANLHFSCNGNNRSNSASPCNILTNDDFLPTKNIDCRNSCGNLSCIHGNNQPAHIHCSVSHCGYHHLHSNSASNLTINPVCNLNTIPACNLKASPTCNLKASPTCGFNTNLNCNLHANSCHAKCSLPNVHYSHCSRNTCCEQIGVGSDYQDEHSLQSAGHLNLRKKRMLEHVECHQGNKMLCKFNRKPLANKATDFENNDQPESPNFRNNLPPSLMTDYIRMQQLLQTTKLLASTFNTSKKPQKLTADAMTENGNAKFDESMMSEPCVSPTDFIRMQESKPDQLHARNNQISNSFSLSTKNEACTPQRKNYFSLKRNRTTHSVTTKADSQTAPKTLEDPAKSNSEQQRQSDEHLFKKPYEIPLQSWQDYKKKNGQSDRTHQSKENKNANKHCNQPKTYLKTNYNGPQTDNLEPMTSEQAMKRLNSDCISPLEKTQIWLNNSVDLSVFDLNILNSANSALLNRSNYKQTDSDTDTLRSIDVVNFTPAVDDPRSYKHFQSSELKAKRSKAGRHNKEPPDNGEMPVLVFTGSKCPAHNLIMSLEMHRLSFL